ETALYYANKRDKPNFPISSRELAEWARVSKRTIDRALEYLRKLPELTGGLRLHIWETGGLRHTTIETPDGEAWDFEETVPNIFEWPSPGGLMLETLNARINEKIAKGRLGVSRCQSAEEKILKELIAEVIGSEKMQQLLREEQKKRLEREAARMREDKIDREERITYNKLHNMPEEVDK